MDGHLLALARREKENIRLRSVAENERRQRVAYERVPALRGIDARLAALIREVVAAASGGGRPLDEIRRESLELQGLRAELLASQGWPVDWLDGAWECPKCRDTGLVEGRLCECIAPLYEKERHKALSALLKLGSESFETFDLTYYDDAAVDPKTKRTQRQTMAEVLAFCRDYAENFGPSSVNLLFQGATGLGKTFLSACIARVVSEKGFSVVYETTVDAISAFEAQRFRPSDEAEERVERILDCELLILDDLGTEMVTEFTRSALYTLINSRLLSGRKTIISTNLTFADISRVYTPQIRSRLQGDYQDLPFVGTDIRLIRKQRGL